MIDIDGSYGQGGGQIIRTAVALSTLTEKSCRIKKIRAGRSKPGLRPQHAKGIETLSKLCKAESKGLKIGSKEITFEPGELSGGNLKVDIGTAGSITLLLQSVMPVALGTENPVEIELKGGTDVKWSPPIGYLKHVLLPLLRKNGYKGKIKTERRGFYPKGGGNVIFKAEPSSLDNFDLEESGENKKIKGMSYASNHLQKSNVAERQRKAALKKIKDNFDMETRIETKYCDTLSPGSGIQIWLKRENSIVGGNALGERGKQSEEIGKEAVKDLKKNLGGSVDRYAGDQLMPYLALSGGKIRTSKITQHCKTNQWVIEKFLPVSFENKNGLIELT